MRKSLALFILLALAAISSGCGGSTDQGGAANSNAPGTTTYSNSSVPLPNSTAAPSQGGASTGGAAPKTSPTEPKIKPPTD